MIIINRIDLQNGKKKQNKWICIFIYFRISQVMSKTHNQIQCHVAEYISVSNSLSNSMMSMAAQWAINYIKKRKYCNKLERNHRHYLVSVLKR